MRELLSYVTDAIFPPRSTERLIRALTLEDLTRLSQDGALPYHDPRVTALIWELKYHRVRRAQALAGAYVGESALALCTEELGSPLLIPVPMHPRRRRERGHNQAETLCAAALPYMRGAAIYAPEALRRLRDTPTQQGLPRAARLQNVAQSMVASPRTVSGRACIVVDDVTTTGATLEEAKRALLSCGARVVYSLPLARA